MMTAASIALHIVNIVLAIWSLYNSWGTGKRIDRTVHELELVKARAAEHLYQTTRAVPRDGRR